MAWFSGADGFLAGGGGVELVPLSVALINSQLAAAFALPGFGDLVPVGAGPVCGSHALLARSFHSTDTHTGAGSEQLHQQHEDVGAGPSYTARRAPIVGGVSPQAQADSAPALSARRRTQQARRRTQQRLESQQQADAPMDTGEPTPSGAEGTFHASPTAAPGAGTTATGTDAQQQQPTPASLQQQQQQQPRQHSQWSQGALELSSEAWGPLSAGGAGNPALRTSSTTNCTTAVGRASAPGLQSGGGNGGGLLSGQSSLPILLSPPMLSEPGTSQGPAMQAGATTSLQSGGPSSSQHQQGGLGAPTSSQQQQQQQQQLLAFMAYQQALAAQQQQHQQQQQGVNSHLLQLQAAAAAAPAQQPQASGGASLPYGGFPSSAGSLLMGPYGLPDFATTAQMLGQGPLGGAMPANSSLSLSTLSQPCMSQGQAAELGGMEPGMMQHLMLMQQQQAQQQAQQAQQMQALMMQSQSQDDMGGGGRAKAVKRPRLVWTPQLHKRFEEAVQKLGDNKAVPKNIMQEMNVEGLTRENVASHLQKYRLQRGQGMGGIMPPMAGAPGGGGDGRTTSAGTAGTVGEAQD